jgi:hydroxymethylpyrimidine kinase/phosphomethylpyrimidine kinase
MASNKPSVVMTIAGFDPSGGAGILADIKTIAAFDCFGVAAITSLTFQNTVGVFGAEHQSPECVLAQLDPLFEDFDVAAIKTGMLPTTEIIRLVADVISARGARHVVVDPVVRSTSGYDLIDDEALRALTSLLFPLASVVTPNVAEAERITGVSVRDEESMRQAAELIMSHSPRAVLVKGGDTEADTATDLLLDRDGYWRFSTARVKSTSTHGTGCTLSSAIACLLASGYSLREALPVAKQYINDAISDAPGLGRGHGPLNHFPALRGRG